MSQSPAPSPTPPNDPLPTTSRLPSATPPSRRGCARGLLSLIGWLLTLLLSVALAIAALAAIAYFLFGFTLATPAQIRQTSADLAGMQTRVATLEAEATRLRSAESEAGDELAAAQARVEALETRVAGYEQQAGELASQAATAVALSGELEEGLALAATIQAEGQEGQVLVAVVATVQADSAARLADLQRRTDRLDRFLQRLSDLAGDAAAENGATAATPTPTPGPAEPTPTPTATP
ncbi:MAG: hypothetical protein OHK0015_51550 [Chloroflexi bacterium OHK40]